MTEVSRSPPTRWRRPGRFLRDLNQAALLIVIAAGAALLLLPASDDGLLGLPELMVGDVSPRTIKSPQAFVIDDPDATEQIRRQRVANLLPTYDLWMGQGPLLKERIEAAFLAAAPAKVEGRAEGEEPTSVESQASAFMREMGVGLEPDVVAPLVKAAGSDELRDAAIMVAQSIYEARIIEDKALTTLLAPRGIEVRILDAGGRVIREEAIYDVAGATAIDQSRARIDELVAEQLKRFPNDQKRAVAALLKRSLKPNLVANDGETQRRRIEAETSVKARSIQVSPGETVLRAGEKVTKQHLSILSGIDRELRAQSRMQSALGGALLVVLLVILGYSFAAGGYRPNRPSHRDLAFLASAYLVTLSLLWVGYKGTLYLAEVSPLLSLEAFRYLLPLAAGSLIVRIVAGAEASLAFTTIVGVTAGWMMDGSLPYTVYTVAAGLAAGSVDTGSKPKSPILLATLRCAFAQVTVVVALSLLASAITLADSVQVVLAAAGSAVLSALVAALFLPVVEVLFGYTTSLKLAELANLNHPLLRNLLVEAPGTYHHSIMVGGLAEAAADAIHANRLLALVGGYYHDIGKLKSPRTYEENDRTALPSLSPADMARELKVHVADGLELAAQHRIGAPLLEIIAQHHGTRWVRAAHHRALEADTGEGISRQELAYGGPRPLTREAALVMLADVVEAATRELAHDPTLSRAMIEADVRDAVSEVVEDGQLDSCDLTLSDLSAVIRAFAQELEERLIRRAKPPTLSSIPTYASAQVVRPPPGGEPN